MKHTEMGCEKYPSSAFAELALEEGDSVETRKLRNELKRTDVSKHWSERLHPLSEQHMQKLFTNNATGFLPDNLDEHINWTYSCQTELCAL